MMKKYRYAYALIFSLSLTGFSSLCHAQDDNNADQLEQEEEDIYNTSKELDDTTITNRVRSALSQESSLKFARINVETRQGVVYLSGLVNSEAEADKAVEVTQGVEGVQTVKQDLQTKR